jgi:signal transduction histidine kinase
MKILEVPFLFCFFTMIANGFSQINKIDSLNNSYAKYQYNNLLKAEQSAREAVILSKKTDNDTLLLKSNNNLLSVLLKSRKVIEAEEIAIENKKLAKKTNHYKYLCSSYLHLGNTYRLLRKYNKSLSYLEKGLSLAQKNNYLKLQHQLLNFKAILLKRTKRFKEAKQILSKITNNEKFNDHINLTYSYNTLAGIYYPLEMKKDSSIFFYKRGIRLANKLNNNYLKTMVFSNYSSLLIDIKKEEESLNYLTKARKSANLSNDNASLFFIYQSLAYHHYSIEDYQKAINYYETAFNDYGKYADGIQIADNHWLLAATLYNNKQYKDGYNYLEKLIFLKDSLFDIEKNKTFEKLQTEFEVEKKNNQIAFLEREKQLKAKEEKLIFSVGGLLVIGLSLLVFIFRYRVRSQKIIRKQEQELFLSEKEKLQQEQELQSTKSYIEGQEIEKDRIALELHDGIVGNLVGLKHFINASNFEIDTNHQSKAKKELEKIASEVRYLSHSLSSGYVNKTPFTNLVYQLAQSAQQLNNVTIDVSFFTENDFDKLSNSIKNNLYRIVQQLLDNTIKHAKASEITLSFTAHEKTYNFIFEDDGIGFDTTKEHVGIGLLNIDKRTKDMNGSLHLDSLKHRGTTVAIEIPRI